MAGMTWPTTCKTITQGYGNKNSRYVKGYHTGIDIGCMAGSPIYAAHDGKVTFAGFNGDYGNQVRIATTGGLESSYNHMSRIAAQVGKNVSAGTLIGYIGTTGNSTGPHLHFEIRVNGKDVDPMPYLNGSSVVPANTTTVEPALSLTSIPGAIVGVFEWLTDTINWLRIGMVILGAVLLLLTFVGAAKTQALGNSALGAVKGAVKTSG